MLVANHLVILTGGKQKIIINYQEVILKIQLISHLNEFHKNTLPQSNILGNILNLKIFIKKIKK
jgi:hypothetical protein